MNYLGYFAGIALVGNSWILLEDGYSIQAHLSPYPLQNPLHPRLSIHWLAGSATGSLLIAVDTASSLGCT